MSDALRIDIKRDKTTAQVTLVGAINEEFAVDTLNSLSGTVVFDFGEVKSINSLGIRKWVNLIKDLSALPVFYDRCSRVIARQLLIVPSLKGHARVRSILVDHFCDDCDKEAAVLVTRDTYVQSGLAPQTCASCKKPMETDLSKGKLDTLFKE